MSRIEQRFAALKREGRAGLITYLTCGDPDAESFAQILDGLPQAGADLIEVGMPFSDPMADGPAIQAAGLRALKAGMTLPKVLAIVYAFRETDKATDDIVIPPDGCPLDLSQYVDHSTGLGCAPRCRGRSAP